jgi:hypothetical protein
MLLMDDDCSEMQVRQRLRWAQSSNAKHEICAVAVKFCEIDITDV